jgi:hypothetical protein
MQIIDFVSLRTFQKYLFNYMKIKMDICNLNYIEKHFLFYIIFYCSCNFIGFHKNIFFK